MLEVRVRTCHRPEWYRRRRKQPVTLFRRAWVWSEAEERLYARLCVGSVLHLCSGYSALGDVRLDINREFRPDVVADVHYLPFRDLSFDTVVIDPPWHGPQSWMKWEQMARDIVRVARRRVVVVLGCLIYVLPRPFVLREVYVVKKVSPMVKLVYVWERADGVLLGTRHFRRAG